MENKSKLQKGLVTYPSKLVKEFDDEYLALHGLSRVYMNLLDGEDYWNYIIKYSDKQRVDVLENEAIRYEGNGFWTPCE